MTAILAQAGLGPSVVHWAILIVVVAAVVGLVLIALRRFNVPIPGWFMEVVWLVAAAVVIILAILFLAKFAGFA